MLHELELLEKEAESRHHKAKSHQRQTGANPGKESPLGSQQITQVRTRRYVCGRGHLAIVPRILSMIAPELDTKPQQPSGRAARRARRPATGIAIFSCFSCEHKVPPC